MKLFLIRHAECEHNVGKTSGNADHSGLTDLGKTQAQLLARHFRDRTVCFTHVLSSDLDRATDTARVICQYQLGSGPLLEPIQTEALREQWFASGKEPGSRRGPSEESMSSMRARANGFLRDHILPLLADRARNDAVVAVVAHGIILQVVWACLADLFASFYLARNVDSAASDYMHPVWSNTGVLELDIWTGGLPEEMVLVHAVHPDVKPPWLVSLDQPPMEHPLAGWSVTIMAVDSTVHLDGNLHTMTVPDSPHRSRQQPMDDFYRLTGTA
ncbi:hypothetical protein NUU61_009568 [Penicillium alfredii]|uniref:Histidine phosphatase family protein n=1 Tax=Penicillium alfredii TaxID=1506179 RepID=A0A9W9EGF6_9EURO|nr:uncharacterized protein NUU61_009568 [Penicillium alfredii]KAJ5081304.1 hypothetical protein NUU61_009568 [Penicillium alfredii]